MNNEIESIGREEFIGETALLRAARFGDVDAIRTLVMGGADINEVVWVGQPQRFDLRLTPLMAAAGSRDGANAETVRVLLELGADAKQIVGTRSALTSACRGFMAFSEGGGDAERMRLLLEAGATFPEDEEVRNKLLCETAEMGDAARLKILLENGFEPDGIKGAVKLLAQETQGLGSDMDFFGGLTKRIDELFPQGMNQPVREEMEGLVRDIVKRAETALLSSQIPLFCAAQSGNAECVRLLIQAGANVQAKDISFETALFHATSLEAVKVLLEAGLNIQDISEYGGSPLVTAVGDVPEGIKKLKALIAAGANVNERHDQGFTVFMSAVGSMERCPEMLRLLIEAGADPYALTEKGYNAFHAAIDVGGVKANSEESIRETFGYLKELGVDIEHRNGNNQTPLAFAVERGCSNEVKVLCEMGTDPNAICAFIQCNGEDCTESIQPLLFKAVRGCNLEADEKARILLEAGADPMVTDDRGMVPLMYAAFELSQCDVERAGAYEELMNAIRSLGELRHSMPRDRKEFVSQMLPMLREKTLSLVAKYPKAEPESIEGVSDSMDESFDNLVASLDGDDQIDRQPRKRMRERCVDMFVILGVYTLWASREMFDPAKKMW